MKPGASALRIELDFEIRMSICYVCIMVDAIPSDPLDAGALRQRLESLVFMVLSTRRTMNASAAALAGFDRARQERFLQAVEFIGQETTELAYNFAMFGIDSLERLEEAEWPAWVQHLLDRYAEGGVLPTIVAMQKIDEYIESLRRACEGVRFGDVVRILEPFVRGLNGRGLKLAIGDDVYTDTETLFLPAVIDRFDGEADNYRLYKVMAVYLWAQTWFGTWREGLSRLAARFADPERAVLVFHALETIRLDACIARELPGIYRELTGLRELSNAAALSAEWALAARRLRSPEATAMDSQALVPRLYGGEGIPQTVCYQGVLFPDRTEQLIGERRQRDKQALQELLAVLDPEAGVDAPRDTNDGDKEGEFQILKVPATDMPDGFRFELRLEGEPIAPAEDMQQLLDSIVQDNGYIPDEYLVPAGHGAYDFTARRGVGHDTRFEVGHSEYVYDEWDYMRKQHRRNWCLLRERRVHPVRDDFVDLTRQKYRGLLKHLYRTFEALRGEDKILKRQPQGDGIDIDAVVQAYTEQQAGFEPSESLFTRRNRVDRDIAVVFLVDMSGSTKGWINEIERESLVLLCEALEILGDRYAIYGFSGLTHRRCDLFRIKDLNEPYGEEVRSRISGIKPQDYTRMGVFIRHITRLFQDIEARTKLLITLSDGRPDDQDGYRGVYGIEDTRQALLEAKYQGIHPFCITIDDEAMEYLPHMYGAVNFTVIQDVHKLPYRVSDIYRRITM